MVGCICWIIFYFGLNSYMSKYSIINKYDICFYSNHNHNSICLCVNKMMIDRYTLKLEI